MCTSARKDGTEVTDTHIGAKVSGSIMKSPSLQSSSVTEQSTPARSSLVQSLQVTDVCTEAAAGFLARK